MMDLHGQNMNKDAEIASLKLDLAVSRSNEEEARRTSAHFKVGAERCRWLIANWGRIVTDTCWNGVDEPRGVKGIELVETLSDVDPESLERAINRAMAAG